MLGSDYSSKKKERLHEKQKDTGDSMATCSRASHELCHLLIAIRQGLILLLCCICIFSICWLKISGCLGLLHPLLVTLDVDIPEEILQSYPFPRQLRSSSQVFRNLRFISTSGHLLIAPKTCFSNLLKDFALDIFFSPWLQILFTVRRSKSSSLWKGINDSLAVRKASSF